MTFRVSVYCTRNHKRHTYGPRRTDRHDEEPREQTCGDKRERRGKRKSILVCVDGLCIQNRLIGHRTSFVKRIDWLYNFTTFLDRSFPFSSTFLENAELFSLVSMFLFVYVCIFTSTLRRYYRPLIFPWAILIGCAIKVAIINARIKLVGW